MQLFLTGSGRSPAAHEFLPVVKSRRGDPPVGDLRGFVGITLEIV